MTQSSLPTPINKDEYAIRNANFIKYPPEIESELAILTDTITLVPALAEKYPPRWLAIQLLEGDEHLLAEMEKTPHSESLSLALNQALERLSHRHGDDIDVALADARYTFINRLARQVVSHPEGMRVRLSDRIDRIVTHRLLGVPIFLVIMWLVFKITTDITAPYLDWIDSTMTGAVSNIILSILTALGLNGGWFESLLLDGLIAGVGGILVFVPVLMSLYFVLALMEDSGYMARAAFVMDRLMSHIGLHGKSFLPMIVGFGCSVPAIYATRTLENRRDRILTGLLVPFMSCSARLPVYVLFAAIFFPKQAGLVIFGLYLLGILAALGVGLIVQKTIFSQHERMPFVMELPPYRKPNARTVWRYIWERTSAFLKSAGTLILMTGLIIWLLMAIPMKSNAKFAEVDLADSAFGTLSGYAAIGLRPLGFGTWESGGALLSGFVAKEVVVSTMSQIHNTTPDNSNAEMILPTWQDDLRGVATGFVQATWDTLKSVPLVVGINLFGTTDEEPQSNLMQAVRANFEASSNGHASLAGLAFMVFVLLYTPCVAAVAAQRHEFGVRWMWTSIVGQSILSWIAAFVIFQGGKLLGLG